MASATIKIFLVHGDPKRLRTAELSNWTGKPIAGPRSEFEGITWREESNSSGVYFLTGNDPGWGTIMPYGISIFISNPIKDRQIEALAKVSNCHPEPVEGYL